MSLPKFERLNGATHAETDWSVLKAPDSDLNTTVVVSTVLAIVVTIVQFLHCLAAAWKKETGLGEQILQWSNSGEVMGKRK
ncbi:hypothetical protein C8J57DRAFT_1512111 [Mycena rebaudengoi]|nr:hypothetical protein C8J57DRAFT_1512111 [Mycena rebaudengoi]